VKKKKKRRVLKWSRKQEKARERETKRSGEEVGRKE